MKTTARLLIIAAMLLGIAAPALAEENAGGQQEGAETVSGNVLAGYRTVGVGGADSRYRTDVNLDKGPRLFDFNFVLTPQKDLLRFADRVDVSLTNFGGDPFETLRVHVQKYHAFDLQYNRTKSTYFYQDIFPTLAAPESAGDLHTFNFDRVHDTAKLGLQLTNQAKFTFAFDRFTKQGTSTTSQDIQRGTTVLDQPIDESMNSFDAGLEYVWPKATLVLDEKYTQYKNAVDLFVPGQSVSGTTVIDFFSFTQPYDYTSHDHSVRLIAHPISQLTVSASALIQRLDLGVSAAETANGISFNGHPFTTNLTGSGSSKRDADIYKVDATYMVTSAFGVIGSFWHQKLDQDGDLTFGGVLGRGKWNISTNGGRFGLQGDLAAGLTLSGGVQYESRDVTSNTLRPGSTAFINDQLTTKSTGYFATAGYKPTKELQVTAEAEDNNYTDPFTLASPTNRQRYRLRAQYNIVGGFYASGSYQYNRFKNKNSGFRSHYDEGDLRLGYRADGLTVSAGYGLIDLDRAIDQVTNVGLFPIDFRAKSHFYDGELHWKVASLWTVAAELRFWRNSGSFGIDRDDLRAFVEYKFLADYLVHVGYRNIRYKQTLYNLDNYNAHIAEFSIGYHW